MERPDSSGALGSPGAPRDASAHAPQASESAKLFSRAEAWVGAPGEESPSLEVLFGLRGGRELLCGSEFSTW